MLPHMSFLFAAIVESNHRKPRLRGGFLIAPMLGKSLGLGVRVFPGRFARRTILFG